ncbi:hypothetical protein CLV98_101786 [Dyadobacter jejuensis]|uniref:Uncharacterized protein n=1 Tax=Dyadobacter jejuensis TaxID=1082580 RepID=A0A316AT04_9BACT|nr:hypothetical protein CLV98_101786 [Dyadobacter jejuensis]
MTKLQSQIRQAHLAPDFRVTTNNRGKKNNLLQLFIISNL